MRRLTVLALVVVALLSSAAPTALAGSPVTRVQEASQTAGFQAYNTRWDSDGNYAPGTYSEISVAAWSSDPVGGPVTDDVFISITYTQFSPPDPVSDFYYWSYGDGSGTLTIADDLRSSHFVAVVPVMGISPSWEGWVSVTFTVDLTCAMTARMETWVDARSFGEPSESRTAYRYFNRARYGGDCTGSIELDGEPVVIPDATYRSAGASTQESIFVNVTP